MRDIPADGPPEDGPPDEAALHDAALRYLARYSATAAVLTRVLNKRVDNWARKSGAEDSAQSARAARETVRRVVAKLTGTGTVNDAAFAETRARRLTRTGTSRRTAAAHLAARGVNAAVVKATLPEDAEAEFASAVAFTRRRRIGAFRRDNADAEERRRELAMMARAGFPHAAAKRALALPEDEAEAILATLRQS